MPSASFSTDVNRRCAEYGAFRTRSSALPEAVVEETAPVCAGIALANISRVNTDEIVGAMRTQSTLVLSLTSLPECIVVVKWLPESGSPATWLRKALLVDLMRLEAVLQSKYVSGVLNGGRYAGLSDRQTRLSSSSGSTDPAPEVQQSTLIDIFWYLNQVGVGEPVR